MKPKTITLILEKVSYVNLPGNYLIIQDANLGYKPEEYKNMLKPVINDNVDVVWI